MRELNFVSCGLMGDFIHALSAIKNICEKDNAKANIYITDRKDVYGGDKWNRTLESSYWDLFNLIRKQPFVNNFLLLPYGHVIKDVINMNVWRNPITDYAIKNGGYVQSWSEFMSEVYGYEIKSPYKWLSAEGSDIRTKGKVAIHRSAHRHNPNFNWASLINGSQEEFAFLTSSEEEYSSFEHKDKASLVLVTSMEEMAIAISSCKFFIGNQSAPFALASALDVPRLVELDVEPAPFYMNETKYSDNISWYLSDDKKYFTENSIVKL